MLIESLAGVFEGRHCDQGGRSVTGDVLHQERGCAGGLS